MIAFVKSVVDIIPATALWLVGGSVFLLVASPVAAIVLPIVYVGCAVIAVSYGVVALYKYAINKDRKP